MSRRILIVDDHTTFRTIVRAVLEADGYDVVGEAPDGRAGLSAALALKPDVVLLDVRLPDMDGFAVALSLAENGAGPAVIVTSSSDDPLYPGARGPVRRPRLRRQARRLRRGARPHPRRLTPGAMPAGARRCRLDLRIFTRMKIVLADDSVLLRAGLARLLEDAGFEVAAQASDAEDLLRKVRAHKPAVAVTDIRMPPTQTDEGLRAAQQIRREMPEVGVMVLSQYIDEGYAVELLQGRAAGVGYLLKDRVADIDAFTDALRRVGDGGSVLDPEVVAQLLGRRRADDPLDRLTPREREVLGQMAQGRSNGAIARELVVTERAIEKHVTSIFSKLGLSAAEDGHRRVLAVLTYLDGN